jgi:hypothetical protein
MMACCKLLANREFKPAAPASRGGSTRHAQTVERQNDPICAPRLLIVEESPAAPNGGYLESSLSMPSLTWTSAALTCSWIAFTP